MSWTPGSENAGSWTRVGNRVFIDCSLKGAFDKGTGSGGLYITGLPFAIADGGTTKFYPNGSMLMQRFTIAAVAMAAGVERLSGAAVIYPQYSVSAGGASGYVVAADLTAGAITLSIYTSLNYTIA